MIRSFRDRAAERLWTGAFVKRFSGIEKQALRKLDMLHAARDLNDLRAPPANRLEALARPTKAVLGPRQRSMAHLLHVDRGGSGQCRNRRLPLRVRLKTSARIAKLSQHEADGGEFQEREGVAVEIFPVLGEAAATVEPRNR